MNGAQGSQGGMPQHEVKPDLAQIHANLMAQHAMSQQGYFPYQMPPSASPPPGMLHSPVSSMGSPGMIYVVCGQVPTLCVDIINMAKALVPSVILYLVFITESRHLGNALLWGI